MSDWIEVNMPWRSFEDDSLRGNGLNNAGTLIRMADGKEFLIGDINELGGVCDDCMGFDRKSIVAAYKIVWQPEVIDVQGI